MVCISAHPLEFELVPSAIKIAVEEKMFVWRTDACSAGPVCNVRLDYSLTDFLQPRGTCIVMAL